ncbi:protein transport protein bet1 [Cyclospora cayetanensis]|uniref:Protein transport protein bet1 n=1 Tax=Cyclospora cayetanensis TaxID=88456 RepID=A0A6P6RY22_9EIME|nr:protein transport protein bet1 [Cyclospora cayetanensis]
MMRKKGEGSEWRQVRNLDSLESENDSYIADLEARVQGLKELSLAMRDEVQASNTLLGTMVGRLEGVRVSVRNSVRRMDQMFKSGGGWHMLHLAAFVLFIFLIFYFFFAK